MSENLETAGEEKFSLSDFIKHLAIMLFVSITAGVLGFYTHALSAQQAVACGVFIAIIFGTLFFWKFRLAIAFIGIAVLITAKCLDIPRFVESSSLPVILFLVGMMIIVGALRDLGFFSWILQRIVAVPNLSGRKFITLTCFAAALLACAVDEVTSIIFISTLIFQVCDRLKVKPLPFIIFAVLATNIGSSGTMMGNPVGIYIGAKGSLTFGDFMVRAFPLMLIALTAAVIFLIFWFRKELDEFDAKLKALTDQGLTLAPEVKIPYVKGLLLLIITVLAIASHHPSESWLNLAPNTVLYMVPLVVAAFVMIARQNRARYYVEHEVDWWTLVFFMMLFAVAGTLQYTGVDKVMAKFFSGICGSSTGVLVPFIFAVSAIGSAFVDNVIFVAAFCPVIEQLALAVKDTPLWWALLFGACYGGNITMIGSTANIVALGMIERRGEKSVTFVEWLKVGFCVTVISGFIVVAGLLIMAPTMPDRQATLTFENLSTEENRSFNGKNAKLEKVTLATLSEQQLEKLGKPAKAANAYLIRGTAKGDEIVGWFDQPLTEAELGCKVTLEGLVYSGQGLNEVYPACMKVNKVTVLPFTRK